MAATLFFLDYSREYQAEYASVADALSAAGWMIHQGKGMPARIVEQGGEVVTDTEILAAFARMQAEGRFSPRP